jgi:AraC family transcriptional regulator, regulatory protein of adaptative response / methylated-DNA-[protein]-cysteine methyltransferase
MRERRHERETVQPATKSIFRKPALTDARLSSQSRSPEAGRSTDDYSRLMSDVKRLVAVGRPATDAEWAAISMRRAARPFLFVVTSTGIICTPGCPARTPGRDRIRVVDGLEAGYAVGARACLRCRPDRLFGSTSTPGPFSAADAELAPDPVQAVVARLTAALNDGDEMPTERELAGQLEMPERKLRELFRHSLGVTPRAWLSARRAEMLRSRLADGQGVTSALYDSGYGSSSAAYEAANGVLGMAPGRYRTGAAGESIRWTVASIPEGVALVAATSRGLCSVRLGHETETLASDLRAEFPHAALARDDAALSNVASIVSDLANGRRRPEADTLPLDVHATAFRRRVWEALRRIPFGETRSYGEIAAEVGAPGAARAVGTACAQNPIPVVVPCHRVVGSDGSLHGYAYGLARKRQLLDAEASGVAVDSAAPALGAIGADL